MTRTTRMAGWAALLLGLGAALGGCTAKVTNLSLVSTNSIDLERKYTLVASDASAKVSSIWFLIYIGMQDMSYYKAIGDCLAQYDGDLMTDVAVTTTSIWFLVGSYTDYRVKGNVWRQVSEGGADLSPGELYDLRVDGDQAVLVSQDGQSVHEVCGLNRSGKR